MQVGQKIKTLWRGNYESGHIVGQKTSHFFKVQLWTGEYCWRYDTDLEVEE